MAHPSLNLPEGVELKVPVAAAGDALQGEEQRQIDEAMKSYYGVENRQDEILRRFYGIVGQSNWGNTQTGTSYTPGQGGNIIGGALGGASLGMGLANGGALSGLMSQRGYLGGGYGATGIKSATADAGGYLF